MKLVVSPAVPTACSLGNAQAVPVGILSGTNPWAPHPSGGVPGIFATSTVEPGLASKGSSA